MIILFSLCFSSSIAQLLDNKSSLSNNLFLRILTIGETEPSFKKFIFGTFVYPPFCDICSNYIIDFDNSSAFG